MRTRFLKFLIAAAALTAFAAGCPVHAEAFEVLVVKNADLKPYQDVLQGIRDSCDCEVREFKLQEEEKGENVLRKSPDAVVAIGTSAFKKVRELKGVPVIYTMVMPSELAGPLPPTLSGVSMDIDPAAYIASMREVFPRAKRIGIVYDPRYTAAFVGEAAKAAAAAGLELVQKQAHDPRDIPRLLDELRGKIDIFWMLPDPTVITTAMVDYLLQFSFQHTVPIFSFSNRFAELGAVASLVVDPYDMGAQAGEIINSLSTGRAGALRVYARTARLTINMKVAAKMGLKIKDAISKRAHKIE
jgi:putative ABC transport system substrate-binding protein